MKYKEMLLELDESNKGIRKFNEEYISKLSEYVKITERIKDISELLQEADQLRRKYNDDELKEKVEVMDADGRKKTILKDNETEYKMLVEEKKELTKKQQKSYGEIIKLQSKKYNFMENIEEKINEIKSEEKLSPKDVFLAKAEEVAALGLPVLESETRSNEIEEIDELIASLAVRPQTLVDFNNYLERNRIRLNPMVKVRFRNSPRANLKKAFTCIKKKMSLKKFKKLIPSIFNVDKYVELGAVKLHGKLLDGGVFIRNKGVKFKNGVKQGFNATKSFVTNIPKRTIKYIKEKYKNVRKCFSDKKAIRELKKDGKTRKEAMEQVYGENKEKHLDYRIVNRAVEFKKDTCQRISSITGKIGSVSKSVCDAIAKPFRYLRENVRDNARREELQNQINRIRTENLSKKRVLINPELAKSRSGYVGSVALITASVLILSIIIFLGIADILGR